MRDLRETLMVLGALVTAASGQFGFVPGLEPKAAKAGFVEVSAFGTGNTLALAYGDADGDGDYDCAIANLGTCELYQNNGTGTFTLLTNLTGTQCLAFAFADFDNDGDQDIAQGRNGTNALFTNTGGGTFTRANQFGALRTNGVAWADVDRDGDLDLAVANGLLNNNQQSALYRNNGDGTFTASNLSTPAQSAALAFGDFDNDGDQDLAFARGGFCCQSSNVLLVNDGNGNFTERNEFGLFDSTSLDWGDYDNDGDLDMAIGNWESGPNRLYINNGNGTFTEGPALGFRDCNTVAWGDADNDGDLDLAVGNGDFTEADSNFVYVNQGNGTFTEVYAFGLGSTDGVAWADVDGDGDLDVAAGNEHTPTQNYLYRNDTDTQSLRVHLIGHRHNLGAGYSNRDGIGARITAYAAGHAGDAAFRLASREVNAHGGFASQNAMDAHFAFPGRGLVDLVIRWPGSGGTSISQTVAGVATGQRLVIDEAPSPSSVPDDASPQGMLRVRNVWPNPTQGVAHIELASASIAGAGSVPSLEPSAEHLVIRDAAGRELRDLAVAVGSASLDWDLLDSDGRAVPAGVYFVGPWVRAPRDAAAGESTPSRTWRVVVVR